MTDWHTDDLFGWMPAHGAFMMVNRLSRLVLDPERFADDHDEPMALVGQGAVYRRSTDGAVLRTLTEEERAERIERLYRPYHRALSELVASVLERYGTCTVLDRHSCPPCRCRAGRTSRPTVRTCASALTRSIRRARSPTRSSARSPPRDSASAAMRPSSGRAPTARVLRTRPRVTSVMFEVRRGLYCDEATGERLAAYGSVRAAIERAVVAAGTFG